MSSPTQQVAAFGRFFAFRLTPHADLRRSLAAFAAENHIQAGAVVTCVGSLEQLNLRFANQSEGTTKSGHFEIVSLVGTFSEKAAHIHISVADNAGAMLGGHLLENNLVYTTAEIVVVELLGVEFGREKDATYGYDELVIKRTP
jgi:uncharacterized protein